MSRRDEVDATQRSSRQTTAVAAGAQRPGDSPGFLLWRVTLRWQRLMTASLRPLDLTHVQFVLLASTWWLTHVAGESPTQRVVACHAGTDPMMTSQVLRTLERKGLIVRADMPGDSRARMLSVTEQGAALARRAVAIVEAADDEFFGAPKGRTGVVEALRLLNR